MPTFEILCVTMHQKDFSKLEAMNIHSDVVFANQCDCTAYEEKTFAGHRAKMISTATRGVGVNRNLALLYASADICLLADDDVIYRDDMEQRVLAEFAAHPDADIFVFNYDETDPVRMQKNYSRTKKRRGLFRMPWSAFQIAFCRSAQRKANLWFSTLYGGGCIFPCGEDSKWFLDAKRAGLTFYVSKEIIGSVSYETSTWFSGFDQRYFYGKGVYAYAAHERTFWLWKWYYLLRLRKFGTLPQSLRLKWLGKGKQGYKELLSYEEYCKKYGAD